MATSGPCTVADAATTVGVGARERMCTAGEYTSDGVGCAAPGNGGGRMPVVDESETAPWELCAATEPEAEAAAVKMRGVVDDVPSGEEPRACA